MQKLQQTIGRHTKRLRKQRHWTQVRLADELNMSLDMIGRIERGQASPSLSTLQHLAQVLDTRPELMLIDDFMMPKPSAERERAYAKLYELLSAIEDDELDWIVSILDSVIRKRKSP